DTIPTGDGIPADAQTIPAGSTPIPTTGGVSAGSFMDLAADVSPAPTLLAESVAEVHANESRLDENQTASEQVFAEHSI
nr:hypothetical protein [Tanacetum cinerariifolium]